MSQSETPDLGPREPVPSGCQLQVMPEAVTELSRKDRLELGLGKLSRWFRGALRKTAADPGILLRKLREAVASRSQVEPKPGENPAESGRERRKWMGLGLRPGDQAQVKSLEEIRATLDDRERCDGLAFMPTVMSRFCGGTYTVRKKIDLFFDERHWRLSKLRNVVILEGVYCEPPREGEGDWAGCDRTCFLFWKEAWLRKVPSDDDR